MQFIGTKGIAAFVAILAGGCAAGFGSGLLVGRQFPAHRFERFGNASLILDTTTGKVCNPTKSPESDNPIDSVSKKPDLPNLPPGFTIVPIQDAYPPACAK